MSDTINNHYSVMLNEAVNALNIKSTGIYVDGTFGEGGHSKHILSKLTIHGRLLAMDRDYEAIKIGEMLASKYRNFTIIHAPFSKMYENIRVMGLVGAIDGILLDLGLCSSQINNPDRGFSFIKNGPLDMRMDVSTGKSAAEWLLKASQKEIKWVLKNFGEERFSTIIAKAIVKRRQKHPILNTLDLSKLIKEVIPYYDTYKHPATRSFLGIRIYINKELEEIIQVLNYTLSMLSLKGRLVVITFNSLEDRIVKQFMRKYSTITMDFPIKLPLTNTEIFNRYKNKCQFKNLGKLKPSYQEIKNNIRSRSAILRYSEKINFI